MRPWRCRMPISLGLSVPGCTAFAVAGLDQRLHGLQLALERHGIFQPLPALPAGKAHRPLRRRAHRHHNTDADLAGTAAIGDAMRRIVAALRRFVGAKHRDAGGDAGHHPLQRRQPRLGPPEPGGGTKPGHLVAGLTPPRWIGGAKAAHHPPPGMAMRIDQPRQQHMMARIDHPMRRMRARHVATRANRQDAVALDGDRPVLDHAARGVYGEDRAAAEQQVCFHDGNLFQGKKEGQCHSVEPPSPLPSAPDRGRLPPWRIALP